MLFNAKPKKACVAAAKCFYTSHIACIRRYVGISPMEAMYEMLYRWMVSFGTALLLLGAGCSHQTVSSADKDVQHDVNAVTNQVKPKLQEIDIGARVMTALAANANLPKSIRVDASPTGVRLKGTVATEQQKQLAGEIAKQTLKPGATVDNEIVVSPPRGPGVKATPSETGRG